MRKRIMMMVGVGVVLLAGGAAATQVRSIEPAQVLMPTGEVAFTGSKLKGASATLEFAAVQAGPGRFSTLSTTGNLGVRATPHPTYALNVEGDVFAREYRGVFKASSGSTDAVSGLTFDGRAVYGSAVYGQGGYFHSASGYALQTQGRSLLGGRVGVQATPHPTLALNVDGLVYHRGQEYAPGYQRQWDVSGHEVRETAAQTPVFSVNLDSGDVRVSGRLRLAPRATPPASPVAGDMFIGAATGCLLVFDGTQWRAAW